MNRFFLVTILLLSSTGCRVLTSASDQQVIEFAQTNGFESGNVVSAISVVPTPTPTPVAPSGRPSPLPTSLAIYPNLLLPDQTFFQQVAVSSSARKVFAHYMLALPLGGPNGGVQSAKQEILMAQSMGLDGFALNGGAWFADPKYQTTTANLFAAAEQLNTGFLLFFSADLNGLQVPDIIDMMTKYNRHPNYYHVDGLPMLSSYAAGNGHDAQYPRPPDWWKNRILIPLQLLGINVYFVPDSTTGPWDSVAANLADWSGVIQGFIDWCVLGVINRDGGNWMVNSVSEANSTALAASHKTFMAAVVNQYWGSLQTSISRPFHDFQAGLGEQLQWEDIINVTHPQWVEILTWNDKEESYMMPVDDFMKYNDWGLPHGYYKPHAGYAELERYYIQWYKTGIKPTLTKDSIFYFYRTQTSNFIASNDPRGDCYWFVPWESRPDQVYLTVSLTAPATLTVNSGGVVMHQDLVAGINQVHVPLNAGAQSFSLSRGSNSINSVQGEPVVSSGELYDYWLTTGFVETAPPK